MKIPTNIKFDRFDRKFNNTDFFKINDLKNEYPYLFPSQYDDSVWIKRRKDSLQILLQNSVEQKFENIQTIENNVNHLFKHIKHLYPKTKIPHIVTLVNNVDYQIKTIYLDSLLLISLDTFLGVNHYLYEGIPVYIKKEMDIAYLPSQIVDKFSNIHIEKSISRAFLSQIIYHGKKLYMQDLLLPHSSDSLKIGYTLKEIEWVESNELYIWKYIIEKQLLYKTEPELIKRFIDPAPFSKFYLEIDNQSPGKIGRWIGWQIVRSYVNRYPEIKLDELFNLSDQILFNKSGYKPRY